MRIDRHDRDLFTKFITSNEDRLIELVLKYAERQGYTRYTSTLKEAWRLSIEGLSNALVGIVERSDQVPEFGPDEDFSNDPGAQFGMLEARRHRARGVNLIMFLGLMKYYRQAYIDLVQESTDFNHPETINLLVNRFYDRTELGYCNEWAGTDAEAQIGELSSTNLQLANEKNKYLTIFESLSSPVILCDDKGKVDNYNNAAGRLLLGTQVPGSRYYEESRQDLDPPDLEEEISRLITEGTKLQHIEKIFETTEGEKNYDVQIERMLDVSHKFSGYTILFNDITDRLQWARQLEKTNRRQQRLIEKLHRARLRLVQSEKMAAIGQLASGIAHEINNPIQYIGENTRFLQEAFDDLYETAKNLQRLLIVVDRSGLTDGLIAEIRAKTEQTDLDYLLDEIPKAIVESLEGVERIATIVSAAKEFARPGTTEKTDVDVNAAITSTVNISANEWKYYADIETDLDPELPSASCVPGELNQAFLNIIVNAAHAIAGKVGEEEPVNKGKINIRTHRDGNWIAIDISDTGPGIPDEIKSKIFDPFFTTKDVGKGIGQGLTVAYSAIVEKHGGELDVQSTPGKGATFLVRLPITPNTPGEI